MSVRDFKIIKTMLDYLHDRQTQVFETVIHAEVVLRVSPGPSLSEFLGAVKEADGKGWLTGIPSRYGHGQLWSISEAGEAARLEMR